MPAEALVIASGARPVKLPTSAPIDPVQRWVWQSRYGTIVIEVRDTDAYVNGQKVVMAGG